MTISEQVEQFLEQEMAKGVTYDELAGTLFVRPDGTTMRIKRAKVAAVRNAKRFDSVITIRDKVVILPLGE